MASSVRSQSSCSSWVSPYMRARPSPTLPTLPRPRPAPSVGERSRLSRGLPNRAVRQYVGSERRRSRESRSANGAMLAPSPTNPGDGGSIICCAIICCASPERSPARLLTGVFASAYSPLENFLYSVCQNLALMRASQARSAARRCQANPKAAITAIPAAPSKTLSRASGWLHADCGALPVLIEGSTCTRDGLRGGFPSAIAR
jgi:hypothetical protein